MILRQEDLQKLETHWAVAAVRNEERRRAHDVANARLIKDALGSQLQLDFAEQPTDDDLLERLATAYEIAASEGLDALLHPSDRTQAQATLAQSGAFRAFEIRRVFRIPEEDTAKVLHILHLASLAYAGDRWADLRRWCFDHERETAAPNSATVTWDRRVLFTVYEGWLRLFRKDSWNDLHGISGLIVQLRQEQQQYEVEILGGESTMDSQVMALRLIALYHWARATELLAKFMLQGQPGGINQDLDLHFEKGIRAAAAAADISLEMLLRRQQVSTRASAALSSRSRVVLVR